MELEAGIYMRMEVARVKNCTRPVGWGLSNS